MKNITRIVCISAVTLMAQACSKGLETYSGEDNIYFLYAQSGRPVNIAAADSTIVSMGYTPLNISDTIIMVPVRVQGSVSNSDRRYVVSVNPASTAKEGTHFEFVQSDFTVNAGNITDSMYIRFFRSAEMKDKALELMLDLEANEHFTTTMAVSTFANKEISLIKHRIIVDDILSRPKYWLDAYLGTFTVKKLFLMSDLLRISPAALNNTISVGEITYFGRFMQRYLNEEHAAGRTVYEEDGTEMLMGPLSQ